MRFFALPAFALALTFATRLPAQQTPYVVGSTVTGHVLCADTNAPARFAKVLLKSTTPGGAGADFMKTLTSTLQKAAASSSDGPSKPQTDEQKRALAAASRSMNMVTDMLNSSTVGLDGAFSFAGVKPGTYYVHAMLPGYIDPFSQLTDEDLASTDPVVRARVAQIPTITVTGTDSARVDLRLERGAAVSGRILYEDGTPASGWTLSIIQPKSPEDPGEATMAAMNQAMAMSGAVPLFKTDDLGHYRISGLPAGDFAIRASLMATGVGISATNMGDGGSGINLAVYSGDTFTRASAKPVHLTAGDEISGVNINISTHTLHSITGHVYAKSDSHTLNVGSITLTTKSNPALNLKAAIRDDGSFHFEYLPPGTYTATVDDAADGRHTPSKGGGFMGISMPNQEILHKYGTDSADVILADSDVDTVRLTVEQTNWTPSPAKKSATPDITPGSLVDSLLGTGDDSDDKP